MSSVNLENLSQEELNKILKEEYEKNKNLKRQTVGQQNLSRELPPSTTSPTQFP